MTRWQLLSYVPLTRPWRMYRDVLAWREASLVELRRAWGDDFPAPPIPPRDPASCSLVLRGVTAALRATQAKNRGADYARAHLVLVEDCANGGRG